MSLPIPRLHLFEIDDQAWFPPFLRERVQGILTHFWAFKAPIVQPATPATLVVRSLRKLLGQNLHDYTFVDFCAGAGGPTPSIEREINASSTSSSSSSSNGTGASTSTQAREAAQRHAQLTGAIIDPVPSDSDDQSPAVDFILTDIHPHLPAWEQAHSQSEHVKYISRSIDASAAPSNLLELAGAPMHGNSIASTHNKKIFRLFFLAFHHLDDDLAISVLQNTLETSHGFGIYELQGRDVGNFFTVALMAPILFVGSWYWFWGDWTHLFFTYIIPVLPFVIVYDGFISCLRTRRRGEVQALIAKAVQRHQRHSTASAKQSGINEEDTTLLQGWRFDVGGAVHTWPGGTMQYFAGIKDD